MKVLFLVFLLLLALVSGCSEEPKAENKLPPEAATVLHSATNVALYSLEPNSDSTNRSFYGCEILGKIALSGKDAAKAVAAFESAIPLMRPKTESSCAIVPRHALRIIADGRTNDFLLCYECQKLEVFIDDKRLDGVHVSGSPNELNAILTAAGIPLAKPPRH